jgi:hypothetical protein
MPSPRTPAQRGRNYTVNIRMSRQLNALPTPKE